MKRLAVSLFLCFVLVFTLSSVAFADTQDNIVETPYVKIIIDGKLTTYNDIPLSVNQRTMLPLREILVNLGVPNDDEHIVWNNTEKSVTIYKDSTKIYLKQGSKTAYVNDVPTELDVAPMGYIKNQRTYIPARFVSQALGKKVVWDGSSKAVLIRDEEEFNKIREILDKSDEAMKAVNKCKFDILMDIGMSAEGFNMNVGITMSGQMDKIKKAAYLQGVFNMFGMNEEYESYLYNQTEYTKNQLTGEWQKTVLSKYEYEMAFDSNSDIEVIKVNDVLCAGLVVTESKEPGEILLKGDIYLDELFSKTMQNTPEGRGTFEGGSGVDFEKFNVEISLNKNTYLINKIDMKIKATNDFGLSKLQQDMNINVTYSEHDGQFEITVPQEVLDSAVEMGWELESEAI